MGRHCFLTALTILLLFGSTACSRVPTLVETQATAQAGGCWPDLYPTPRQVTVTPAFPLPTTLPGAPTATMRPTTTPFPRCPPAPGSTAIPWPTPVPPPPPYPTMEPRPWQGGSDQQNTLFLPSNVLTIDLATHPTESWAAVGAVVWSGNDDPERGFVSVYHPQTRRWSPAHQVDVGPSQIGRYARRIAVGITGDRKVHAVWGMSDPDFRDNDPPAGIWASQSLDFGASWTPPQRIASDCRQVNGLATSTEGDVVVMLVCNDGPNAMTLAMVTRQPDGTWLPPDRLGLPVWYFTDGDVVIVGEGADARAVGIAFAERGGAPAAYLVSRRLAERGSWEVSILPVVPADGSPVGLRMWHARGLAFTRPGGAEGIVFTWTDAEQSGAYAITSLDGGRSWGPVETIVPGVGRPDQVLGKRK